MDRIEPVCDAACSDDAPRRQRIVIEPRKLGPEHRARHRSGFALETDAIAGGPAAHADGGDIDAHQRLVVGIVVVTLGDHLSDDLAATLLIGAEMREGGITAQQLAVVHAHDAAAERVVDAVFDLVEPVQQRRKSRKAISTRGLSSTAASPRPSGFSAQAAPLERRFPLR
nr:hypothetical protein [Bradyrhizobium sp. Ec3.3]